ncbi:MAG: 50S ribosomal protein L35 [Flavobacteriales bacterium]
MPKMKPNRSGKKRFSFTGKGKVKRKRAYKSHLLTKKDTKRKRYLTKSSLVDKSDKGQVRRQLGQ